MQLWAMGIPQPDIQLRVVGAIASQTTFFYMPETHLQDPTAWRHQKGMQEQSNISPNNQAIPLGVHLNMLPIINMQLCKPTWHSTFPPLPAAFPPVSTCSTTLLRMLFFPR